MSPADSSGSNPQLLPEVSGTAIVREVNIDQAVDRSLGEARFLSDAEYTITRRLPPEEAARRHELAVLEKQHKQELELNDRARKSVEDAHRRTVELRSLWILVGLVVFAVVSCLLVNFFGKEPESQKKAMDLAINVVLVGVGYIAGKFGSKTPS